MLASALASSLHILTLALGLGALVARGRAIRGSFDAPGLKRLFLADTLWGVAALLWIFTGLLRAFAGLEKGSAYYLHNRLFILKMALFLAVFALEVWPMMTFIRWRIAQKRGVAIDTSRSRMLWRINQLEFGLVIAIVLVASLMARGIGY